MTWFVGDNRSFFQKFFGNILINGPMPKHIGIIMDGNRRFAKSKNIEKIEGHKSGFEKLAEVISLIFEAFLIFSPFKALGWCLMMNVKEISVYAFSIENFKRTKEEIDGLFDLARSKLKDLINEKSKLKQFGICVRFFGNINLLPKDVQIVIADIIELTKHHRNFYLNLCISYTSRDEMSTSIRDVNEGIMKKYLKVEDINETIIENSLFTNHSFNIDLLIRTSGEIRLSDFLLWQSNLSVLVFAEKTWPEYSIWGFYMAILKFQLNHKNIQNLRLSNAKQKEEFLKNSNSIQNRDEITKQLSKANIQSYDELIELTKNAVFFSRKKEIDGYNKRKDFYYKKLISKREKTFQDLIENVSSCNL